MPRVKLMKCMKCGRVQKVVSRKYPKTPRCPYCGGVLVKLKKSEVEEIKNKSRQRQTKMF